MTLANVLVTGTMGYDVGRKIDFKGGSLQYNGGGGNDGNFTSGFQMEFGYIDLSSGDGDGCRDFLEVSGEVGDDGVDEDVE